MSRRGTASFGTAHSRRAFGQLVLTEAKLAWRQPAGLVYGLGFPVVLLVIFGSIPKFREPMEDLDGLTLLSVYVPVLTAFGFAMLSLVGMATVLAGYREQGILRRLSTTPVQPSWVLAAQLMIDVGIAAVAVVLILLIAAIGFGMEWPRQIPGFVLAAVLTAAALFALGLLVAAVARSAQAAGAIGSAAFFPMMFFAGLWIPRELMPDALRGVSDCTPLGAAVQAMQSSTQGDFPSALSLLILAAYAVVFWVAAVRSFRWE